LFRTLLRNAVQGVTNGHSILVTLKGVGYRAALEDNGVLNLKLGYPNAVRKRIPEGVTCSLNSATEIMLQGVNKHQIGQFASDIRQYRKPEPYNGKGIFVGSETIRRKEVKKK